MEVGREIFLSDEVIARADVSELREIVFPTGVRFRSWRDEVQRGWRFQVSLEPGTFEELERQLDASAPGRFLAKYGT